MHQFQVAQQMLSLFAAERAYLEDIKLTKISDFETSLLTYTTYKLSLLKEIDQTNKYKDEIEAKLNALLDSLKATHPVDSIQSLLRPFN